MSDDVTEAPVKRTRKVRKKRGRPPKPKPEVWVDAYPVPYVRKKRGRPKKVGRPKVNKQPYRASPAMRVGQRFKTVSLKEDAYYMLKEVASFYKITLGACIAQLVKPAFDKAYQESLTLQRIEETRKKAKNETPVTDDVPRRTHF